MKTGIIHWVMAWDGIVTEMHKTYITELMITPVKFILQYIVIKKTMESISFDYRRGVEEDIGEQIPELCNELEIGEVIEETKVDNKDGQKVAKQ